MNFQFYNFPKQRNSMAIPAPGTAVGINGRINDASSSVISPVIRIAGHYNASIEDPPYLIRYNYVYISEYGRFYFINDWHYNSDNTWTAFCEVDVLGSFRTAIQESDAYIERSSKIELYDDKIVDFMYPSTPEFRLATSVYTLNSWSSNPGDGCFVLGIVSADNPVFGSVNYYIMSALSLTILVHNMMDSMGGSHGDWVNNTDIIDKTLKSIVNPMQYITSCKWFPFAKQTSDNSDVIMLGSWNTGAMGHKLSYNEIQYTFPFNIPLPAFPEVPIEIESRYPKFPPYSSCTLYSKVFGAFPISPVDIYGSTDLHTTIQVNLISGTGTVTVTPVSVPTPDPSDPNPPPTTVNGVIAFKQIQIGYDIPITEVTTDYIALGKSIAGSVGGVVSSAINGDVLGVATTVFNGVLDAASISFGPSVNSSEFSRAAFDLDMNVFRCELKSFKTIEQRPYLFGYSVCKYTPKLSTAMDGSTNVYLKTMRFHLITASFAEYITKPEITQLEAMMDGGVYYY